MHGNFYVLHRLVGDEHRFDIREVSKSELFRIFEMFNRVYSSYVYFGTISTTVEHIRFQRLSIVNGHVDRCLADIMFDKWRLRDKQKNTFNSILYSN